MLLYGPYVDFIAANFGAAAVLAALDKCRKTGQGSRLDLSQYEAGLHFIAGALLDYRINGRVANRKGNSHGSAAPHGAFECRNRRWLTLSCWSDEEFSTFCHVIGRGELINDKRFSSLTARKENELALNDIVETWSRSIDADEAATMLQNAGICAYPVNTVADVFSDEQLRKAEIWHWRRHPVMGKQAYMLTPFTLSATPGDIFSPAPMFGGDNQTVFQEYLQMLRAEYDEYQKSGIIGESPINLD
jgi:crotonobetainyl-CoA:carnitine CoA-transferase CaiB-like acyl-CoA transferase